MRGFCAAYDEAFEKEFGADMSDSTDSNDDDESRERPEGLREVDLAADIGRQHPGGGAPGAVTSPISDKKHKTAGKAQAGVDTGGQHVGSTGVDTSSEDAWSWAERWEQEQWEKNNKNKNSGSHTSQGDAREGDREHGHTNGGDDGIGGNERKYSHGGGERAQIKRRTPSRRERMRRDFEDRGDSMRDSGNSGAQSGGGGLVSLDALTTIMNAATADQIGDVDDEGHARGPCRCCRGDQKNKQEGRGDGGGAATARETSKKCCFAFASRSGWKGPGGAVGSRTLTLFDPFCERKLVHVFRCRLFYPAFHNNMCLIQTVSVFFFWLFFYPTSRPSAAIGSHHAPPRRHTHCGGGGAPGLPNSACASGRVVSLSTFVEASTQLLFISAL